MAPMISWIWRRCWAGGNSTFAVGLGPAPSSSAAIGFTEKHAAVATISPLVEPNKNLRGKAFRFGIFWRQIEDGEVRNFPCFAREYRPIGVVLRGGGPIRQPTGNEGVTQNAVLRGGP